MLDNMLNNIDKIFLGFWRLYVDNSAVQGYYVLTCSAKMLGKLKQLSFVTFLEVRVSYLALRGFLCLMLCGRNVSIACVTSCRRNNLILGFGH